MISNENGVLTVNDDEVEINITKEIPEKDKIYLVHSTNFFPENRMILSNSDGKKSIPFQYQVDDDIFVIKNSINPRKTVHFCINGKVENTANGEGKWDDPKFIIIEPYVGHENEFVSGNIHGGDNFTNNSVKLSDKAILVVKDDVYDTLTEEQKNTYRIVKYKGDSNKCIDNFFAAMSIPKVENYANDVAHFMSKEMAQEEVLDKRSQVVKLIKNADLSHSQNNYYFTTDDIAMLYNEGISSRITNEEDIRKISEELGINSESIANFMLSNGVVKIDNGRYSLLSTDEVERHLNDPDYYIEAVKKSGSGLSELKSKIELLNEENYQNSSLLEQNHRFEDITIGQLQVLQNYGTLKHLKDKLDISKDKVLILREDGLYLSDKIEKDVYAGIMVQDYKNINSSEILLGSNTDTLDKVISNYKKNSEIATYVKLDELEPLLSESGYMFLGHGTGRKGDSQDVVDSIFNEGLRTKDNSLYLTTIGLSTPTPELKKQYEDLNLSEPTLDNLKQQLNNWPHMNSKEIIIARVPTDYINTIGDQGDANGEKFGAFYKEIKQEDGKTIYYLDSKFIVGCYDVEKEMVRLNNNFEKILSEDTIHRLKENYKKTLEKTKERLRKMQSNNIAQEELQEMVEEIDPSTKSVTTQDGFDFPALDIEDYSENSK